MLSVFANHRKQELYSMGWNVEIDPDKFHIAVAPYGGPIGKLNRLPC